MTSKNNGDSIIPFRSQKKPKKELATIEILELKRFQICSVLDPYFGLPPDTKIVTKKGDPPPIAFLFEVTFDILVYTEEGQKPIPDELTIRKFAIAYASRLNKSGHPEVSTSTIVGYPNLAYEVDFFDLFPVIQQYISEQIGKSAELKMLFRKMTRK